MQRIYLLGFMGCGKSFLGQKLALELGWTFADLDDRIESKAKATISQIFETKGEDYFRKLERDCLYETANDFNTVIALGGGTPCFFENMQWIKNNGCCFFLDVSLDVLIDRLLEQPNSRPLLQGKNIEELRLFIIEKLENRRPFYSQASYTIKESNNAILKIKGVLNRIN